MSDESLRNRSFKITEEANERLKVLPKQLGVTQPELISALILFADPEDPKLIEACAPFRKIKGGLLAQVEQMSAEERAALKRRLAELED